MSFESQQIDFNLELVLENAAQLRQRVNSLPSEAFSSRLADCGVNTSGIYMDGGSEVYLVKPTTAVVTPESGSLNLE